MNGSVSQSAIYKPSSLALLVISTMDNVVLGTGLPMESCENKDNQQAY